MILDSIATDLKYAIRQLRDFGDVERALDALSRIEMDLPAVMEEVRTADAMLEAVTGDLEPCLWRIGYAEALIADLENGNLVDDEDPRATAECIALTRKMLAMLRAAAEKALPSVPIDASAEQETPDDVPL
jgi:hypothetical protein